jgi:DNA-nicking Smr family endonuclease
MADDPAHNRRKITERDVMKMLLRGDNMHEIGALEVVSEPPKALLSTRRDEENTRESHEALPAEPPEAPAIAHPPPGLFTLKGQLQPGSQWDREPALPLEGITSYVAMNPHPRDASEIFVVDLHGTTRLDLERALHHGLSNARDAGRRFVRIITGRGLHSEGGYPVLRSAVELWLAKSMQAGTLAACAREDHIAMFAPDYGSFMTRLPSRRVSNRTDTNP